ncbi:hypothetical protein GCM10009555_014320 [Acrocarpospora macrocephala]|uniref:Uncharacterized protein n=1 Tax=Acrocarpospora macrocephala TaxID=150177 RepID=A0A5M3WJ88_9ACTN|nr:HEXXH motif-containing putative peptide modification protein [Acrocarpospora macrocephala]GES08239.1 hypothetical protein Amac_018350 [Acrocarpospora macrocephala]
MACAASIGTGDVLKDHHPWYAEEVLGGVTTFVPLSRPAGRPTSATSRYAFGAFAGSLPPNGWMLASLLSHEVQHSKLWALLDLIPLTARAALAVGGAKDGRTIAVRPLEHLGSLCGVTGMGAC